MKLPMTLASTFHTLVLYLQILTMKLELLENAMCLIVSVCPCLTVTLLKKLSLLSMTVDITSLAVASCWLFLRFCRRYCPLVAFSVSSMNFF